MLLEQQASVSLYQAAALARKVQPQALASERRHTGLLRPPCANIYLLTRKLYGGWMWGLSQVAKKFIMTGTAPR